MDVFVVKALNTVTNLEFILDGPKGRILHMTIGNYILFAGAEVIIHTKLWSYLCQIFLIFLFLSS